MSEKTLTVIEQKEVIFYGDDLTAVKADDGHVYVSLSHMCNALGIDRASQVKRIGRSDVLSDGYQWCVILTHHRGEQRIGVLRVDLVPMWLTSINAKSVKPEIQAKLKRFQLEAAKILWQAFQDGRLTTSPDFQQLLNEDSPAAQAYKMARAIMRMAEQQLLIEAELKTVRDEIGDHDRRLESIEAQLADPGRRITPAQATAVSQAVKAIAMVLSKRSGRNEYGGVYGELYRRYQIPEYRQLPAAKFDDCMTWLREWYEQLEPGDIPF